MRSFCTTVGWTCEKESLLIDGGSLVSYIKRKVLLLSNAIVGI